MNINSATSSRATLFKTTSSSVFGESSASLFSKNSLNPVTARSNVWQRQYPIRFLFAFIILTIFLVIFLTSIFPKGVDDKTTVKKYEEVKVWYFTSGSQTESQEPPVQLTVPDFMDLSADPCQDFYKYACGNFDQHVPEEFRNNSGSMERLDLIAKQIENSIIDAFESNKSSANMTLWNSHRKAKQVFQACVRKDLRAEIDAAIGVVDDLGGFRLTRNDTNPTPPLTDLLAKAHSYSSDVLFSLHFLSHNSSPEIALSGGITPPETVASGFQEFAKLVNADNEEAANVVKFANGLSYALADLSLSLASLLRRSSKASANLYSIEMLSKSCPSLKWDRLFSKMAHNVNADGSETVKRVRFSDNNRQALILLNRLLEYRSKTEAGRRAIHNFVVFKVYSRFITTPTRAALMWSTRGQKAAVYLANDSTAQPDSKRRCIQSTIRSLPFAIGSFAERHFRNITEAKSSMNSILLELKTSMNSFVDASSYTEDSKMKFKEGMAALKYQFGFPAWTSDERALDDYHANFLATPSHLQNSINAFRFDLRNDLISLGRSKGNTDYPLSVTDVAFVDVPTRKVYVSLPAMVLPFFDNSSPNPVLAELATFGTIVAHEMYHAFNAEIPEGDPLKAKRESCTKTYLRRFVSEDVSNYPNYRTLAEDMADMGGIKVAFQVFQSLQKRSGQPFIISLPNSQALNEDQAFFVTVAQNHCAYLKSTDGFFFHSPGPHRVNGTLAHLEEFTKAFNCPLNSPMNPKRKCQVF